MNDELVRINEAAKMLQITPATMRNLIKRGHFPGAAKIDPTRRNSPLRIPKQEIEDYKITAIDAK